ncbi:uncharacterized protein [Macrobrachium rosenbergii]|uniref:uncharacterized protein n=1 Tax=Macrobrachium rosenbergii TaxID=79674 RepID=UPI0034D3C636
MALTLLPNNAMTFTENQHGTNVLEKLRSQRELVRCCDVILHVAGLQFQAHRCVLAACSPYFDSIFKAGKTVKEQLTISSQDPEVFRCLLAYMYTGTVVVDKTNVAELLRLANKLLIAKLKEHCEEYLERYLDTANCLTVRDMATKFNLVALEKTTGTFIQSHLTEVIEGEEILDLSYSRLEDFLRSPCWQLQEDQTLLLVTRWVHHCPKIRERNLRSLLTWVQWCHLDPKIATQLIQSHPLYSSLSSLLPLFFLLDALNDNSLLEGNLCNLFFKLKAKYCQLTDSVVVDNESFMSLAISTAIGGLNEDQNICNRPQETSSSSDFCGHGNLPLHTSQGFLAEVEKGPANNLSITQSHQNVSEFPISFQRSCEEQDEDQPTQYDLCRANHNSDDMHISPTNLVFPHQTLLSNVTGSHAHISEDSAEDANMVEEDKFSCNTQEHFGQPGVRNMSVWHQEAQYGNEESLSSDSGHMYQRQVYDQGFSLKLPSSDSYNARISQTSSFSARENMIKSEPNFASAVSYYVSNYNPEDDMTVSDDQSTQSFQYDENFNAGMNFYPCRLMEVKDAQHSFMEPLRNQEAYPKTYYPGESNDTPVMSNIKRELYYNENSTDTQLSNCPQDMTIQNQISQCSKAMHDMMQNKDMSSLECTDDVTQNDPNMPVSLVTEQQHFDHCPVENSSVVCEELHRDITRSSCDSANALSSREIVADDVANEGKRNVNPCDFDMRNFVFEKGAANEQKEVIKESPIKDRNAPVKTKTSEQVNVLEGEKSRPHPSGHVQLLTPLAADVIPRHGKFKTNRNANLVPAGLNTSGSSKLQSITGQDLHSEDSNPDDPDEVNLEDSFMSNKSKQASPEKHEILKEPIGHLEEDKGGTGKSDGNKNLSLPRRMSTRSKMVTNNDKGTKTTTTPAVYRVCDLCQSSFSKSKDYFAHMRDHFPGPPHRCDTCEASFKRIYHLLDHLVIHQETKNYKCPTCNFSAHKKFNLTEHMMQHTKAEKYKCKVCGQQFNRIQVLHTHETKHTNDRPFLCETCGWSGKTKNALITHVKIHTGDLLKCQFPNCKYETAKKSHLKEHMQSHSKSRPCVCTVCGNNFITNSHLKRHMKLHLSEKPFKCLECDYATMRRDYLKTHVMKKHTKKESAKVTSTRKREKKSNSTVSTSQTAEDVTHVITAHIECSQADIFSDLENTNVSLQPQLPGTPPPTTLTEYPPSPTYTFQAQSGPDDTLMIVPDMGPVSESFAQLPQASPLHRNLSSSLTYDESYHSPQYQTSPSHFATLSPTNAALSYTSGQQQEESPLNFAAYMKYD